VVERKRVPWRLGHCVGGRERERERERERDVVVIGLEIEL
jgi:hypothetical protein